MATCRRTFALGLTGAAAAAALVRFPAGAAEFTFKLGSDFPVSHPIVIRSVAAAAKIRLQTNGRVEIRVFANNLLGGESEMIAQARLGALEMVLMNYNSFATLVPVINLNSIPFAFAGSKDVYDAFDGSYGKYLRTAIAKANIGLYQFEKLWGSGFRQMSSSLRPIYSPNDLRGMKIRIPSVPVIIEMYKALGATPTPTGGAEIYTALQTHLVDGGDVTLLSTESGKYYEVQKFMSITNHQYQAEGVLINAALWQRLPPPLRDAIEGNFNTAAVTVRTDIDRLEASTRATLEGQGLTFNNADIPAFRASLRTAGLYAKWRDQIGSEAWALLERAAGKLA